jgi:hypothetical protein
MQLKITKAAVEQQKKRAVATSKKVYVWDTELRGFGFYASSRGSVSWLAQKWKGGKAASGGRPVRWVIGQYPHVQPEDARSEAASQLTTLGKATTPADLMTPNQRGRERLRVWSDEGAKAPKLGECIALYLKLNRKPGRYWAELERTFERDVVPALGGKDMAVADITDAALQHIDAKRAKHPGAARNCLLRPTAILQVVRQTQARTRLASREDRCAEHAQGSRPCAG